MYVRSACLALVLLTGSVHATTFVSMPDEALLAQSNSVVFGEVSAVSQATTTTDYVVNVLDVLKGGVSSPATVRVPGGSELDIVGSPGTELEFAL